MDDPVFWHRLQFGFTATFHYLFPQLTMGLALLIAILKGQGLRTGEARYHDAARFWIRIFGLNFLIGVVTGIPLEFQFGTNWAAFSRSTGPVIGHTLAMEGVFAFFLESSFLALLVFGERRVSARVHFAASVALFLGTWLSGFFIVATNAFMQHPEGYRLAADGTYVLDGFWSYVLSGWAIAEYLHVMAATVVTAAFVMAAVGAFWALAGLFPDVAKLNLKLGAYAGAIASMLVAFPTGDSQAKLVARHQPVALAAMEGRFESGPRAGLNLIGQPNVSAGKVENAIRVPGILSVLAFGSVEHDVRGLTDFPKESWPPNVELLYYAFHIMAGLGTLMILVMLVAAFLQWRGRLFAARGWLWVLMLSFPAPYIATIAGWTAAELGRQPWIVYGLMKTDQGVSPTVHAGMTLFTTLGFAGVYLALGLLFVMLVTQEIRHGPPEARPLPEPGARLAPEPPAPKPEPPSGIPAPAGPLTRRR